MLPFCVAAPSPAQWDHRTFPGAVPRSFIPSIILGIVSTPTAITMNVIGASATAIDVQQIGEFEC
jgi:alpha-1,6-mannosyltransferase